LQDAHRNFAYGVTVFRTEYLQALKGLTHNHRPDALISVMDFAWRYTQQINFSSLEQAWSELTSTHAFESPADALGQGARLVLPESLRKQDGQ